MVSMATFGVLIAIVRVMERVAIPGKPAPTHADEQLRRDPRMAGPHDAHRSGAS
jgi:hypothetical protein